MEFFVSIAELLVGYMSIDLGGCDIGVAEEHLDTAEVSAV
jgi:hypothetical protein